MSKASLATHFGRGASIVSIWSCVRETLYANWMYVSNRKSAEKRPPVGPYASPTSKGKLGGVNVPGLLCLIEATSNSILPPAAICHGGTACVCIVGAVPTP